nr:trigger factor [Gemmatimonadaceae bacterium]
MDITITPGEVSGVSRRLQVTVSAADVSATEERIARNYARRAQLPGFRQGKAPPAMIRKKFAEAIRGETVESVVQEAFKQILERENLDGKLAAQPHINDLKAEDGAPMEFELHYELRPEVTLANVDGFTVTRRSAVVTDETVDEQLTQIREQKAVWAPMSEKPMPGDQVTVLLTSADPDGTLPEARQYKIVIGGGQAIAGIEELIMEAGPGETVERPVRWPDDFPDESQRGVTKLSRVTVEEVKRKTLPALDDAFAREVSELDTIDALRAAVREDLAANAGREAEAEARGQLLDQLIAANPFDVPNAWVNQLVAGYGQMYGIGEEQMGQFRETFRPMAERQVRRDLVIDTLAEREGLKASESDVDAKVEELAKDRNLDPGQLYATLQKNN